MAVLDETEGRARAAVTAPAGDRAAEGHRWRRVLERTLGVPATEGNQLDVLRNGDEIFPAMLDAIRAAERSVDMLTFVYWRGQIADDFATALAERARAGVEVRVLLDAFGARPMSRELIVRMTDAGADVRWFRPLLRWKLHQAQHRTHRKLLVCDGVVGFTGGVGIAEEWCGDARGPDEWRDTHLRVRGPAVDGLLGAFIEDWCQVVDRGCAVLDDPPDHGRPGTTTIQVVRGSASIGPSDVDLAVRTLLEGAQRRVRIATAYFIPDRAMIDHLLATRERGVDIEVLLPGPHIDKRIALLGSETSWPELLEAGVAIRAFQPTMLHCKVTTVDGAVAMVGSANFNSRSMDEDDETSLLIHDPAVVDVLDAHMDADIGRAVDVDPTRWADRSLRHRTQETAAKLLRRKM
jgi:cardiolipin synthase A/B